jgi:hypothetical protein
LPSLFSSRELYSARPKRTSFSSLATMPVCRFINASRSTFQRVPPENDSVMLPD